MPNGLTRLLAFLLSFAKEGLEILGTSTEASFWMPLRELGGLQPFLLRCSVSTAYSMPRGERLLDVLVHVCFAPVPCLCAEAVRRYLQHAEVQLHQYFKDNKQELTEFQRLAIEQKFPRLHSAVTHRSAAPSLLLLCYLYQTSLRRCKRRAESELQPLCRLKGSVMRASFSWAVLSGRNMRNSKP